MRSLKQFLALSPASRAIVVRSMILLPVVAVLLKRRGMYRTIIWLERRRKNNVGNADKVDNACTVANTAGPTLREMARLVGAASSKLGMTCLPRSLVLCHLLRDSGSSPDLRLGVTRHPDNGILAHAWVEIDGVPLIDGPEVRSRYAALPSIPARFSGMRLAGPLAEAMRHG